VLRLLPKDSDDGTSNDERLIIASHHDHGMIMVRVVVAKGRELKFDISRV
jgi:hypothetical protein